MYNGVVTLRFPRSVTSTSFADDIGITILASHVDDVEVHANEAIWQVKSWLQNAWLALAEHKKVLVLVTKRRKNTSIKIKAGDFRCRTWSNFCNMQGSKTKPSTSHFKSSYFGVIVRNTYVGNRIGNVNNRRKIAAASRPSLLQACCAYRTTFNHVAFIIAEMIPINILLIEVLRFREAGELNAARQQPAKDLSLVEWQKQWDKSKSGHWPHKLVTNVVS